MNQYIALLRGINVGGNNILPMAELRQLLTDLGLSNVRSYIQSGNVVFHSKATDKSALERQISEAVEVKYGFKPRILILEAEELTAAVAGNPFPDGAAEPKTLHLFFLAEAAGQPDIEGIEAAKKESEHYQLTDKVFYLYAPEGIGRSKLAAKVEKMLGVPATARNWRSVGKIIELAAKE